MPDKGGWQQKDSGIFFPARGPLFPFAKGGDSLPDARQKTFHQA
jgi:hypothetical protein